MCGCPLPDTSPMWGRASLRRWPYVVGATGLVTGMPACAVTFLAPSGSVAELLGGMLLAVVLSIAAAKAGAALWMRHPLARDVLFADLMVWEWARRLWVERRLTRVQSALDDDHLAPEARAGALRDLARLLEARDAYTHGHSQRVARHALRIAQALRVPAEEVRRIWTAATLHDVGKLYTPREILNKPGRLTDEEFDVIRRHPVDGAAMLVDVEGDPEIVAIVRSHHERLDGRGYPDGLAGQDIPLGARIIAVADTFDALTSTRSYRPAASHKRALDILRKEAGTQLDGAAVAAFLRTYSGRRPAAISSLVTLAPQRLLALASHQAGAVASLAPAAGWIAPAAAAAAALFGASHGTGATASPNVPPATTTAAVRVAPPARTALVVASKVVPTRSDRRNAPASPKARRPAPKRHNAAPQAPTATHPAQTAPATATASAASASPAPATPGESGPAPAAEAVREIAAGVKVPSPPPVSIPTVQSVVAPVSQTVTTVTSNVTATVDAQVANVTPVVTTLLSPH
jgi:putative nucleotidyltransferase with HDIG domain